MNRRANNYSVTTVTGFSIFLLYILQETLDDITTVWNHHRIRPYRQRLLSTGRPWLLHTMPNMYGSQEYGVHVDRNDIQACAEETTPQSEILCCEMINDLCLCILEENQIEMPNDPEGRRQLYLFIRSDILDNL